MRAIFMKCGVAIFAVLAQVAMPCMAEDCKSPTGDCVAVGKWNFSLALGAGLRTNPLDDAKNIPLVVIPQFNYYGKRFFIDNLDLGVTLAENNANTLNLIASPSYDRVYFVRGDLQNFIVPGGVGTNSAATPALARVFSSGAVQLRPPHPHISYLVGPEWTFTAHSVSGQLDLLREVTGQYGGDEIRAAVQFPFSGSPNSLNASIGVTWKSAALVNYYYGAGSFYSPGSALNPFVKLGYTRPLAGKWSFTAFAHYEHLGSAIARSPYIVRPQVVTFFAGFLYTH